MEGQALTIGLVTLICGAVGGAFVVYRFMTGYVDKQTSELENELKLLAEKHSALELRLVQDHPTNVQVGAMISRVEIAIEKLIGRLDVFGDTFNKSLLELAKRPATTNGKRYRR